MISADVASFYVSMVTYTIGVGGHSFRWLASDFLSCFARHIGSLAAVWQQRNIVLNVGLRLLRFFLNSFTKCLP